MRVKATTTFAGTASENDASGYVKKNALLDVTSGRANELKRAGLVKDHLEPAAPIAAPAASGEKDKK